MKKIYLVFSVLLVAVAFLNVDVDAQLRYVDVEPGVGTLNDAIAAVDISKTKTSCTSWCGWR